MSLELVPIGTVLALLSNQIVKTAHAANDVIFEKESFRALSEHLFAIEPVLKELQLQKLNDSKAARLALLALEADVKRANNLVEKYKNRARFYLLLKCRHIVKEVEGVTRDIGRSLASLSVANTEVLSAISDQVTKLQNEMQRVEFEAAHPRRQIVDKLHEGLKECKLDQGFANDMLEEIAKAVGVPVEPSEISKELASFRKEKEEASYRKERAEVFFLEQVIELLSRADAAKDYEEVKLRYLQRVQAVERFDQREEYIPPFNSFICPISRTVMTDPVSLSTSTTCERAEIEAWFDRGEKKDPETGEFLDDLSLRSNLPLRQSIEEWRELNYCLIIRSLKTKLISEEHLSVQEALTRMQDLIRENPINKDWISISGLADVTISILGSSNDKGVQRLILITLQDIVKGHARNKEKVLDSQGLDHIIACLEHDSCVSKLAVELLYELMLDRSGFNVSVLKKTSQQHAAIPFLVALLNDPVTESAERAEKILIKLCDADENVPLAAKAGWYKPLIDRIVHGSESSRMSTVRTLVNMEINAHNLERLGEGGVIPILLEMASGNIESKELSLTALVKLSGCSANKALIAAAGGVSSVLKIMFSSHVRTVIIVRCCEFLDKLSSNGDGIKFLVDENGSKLDLELIVTNLLAFQQNPISSHNIRRPALRALLEICKSEATLVKKAVLNPGGVSVVLPLLDDCDLEIRETAINLLFLFSQHDPEGVSEYLLRPRRLESLVGFLENDDNVDIQIAAVGLLANLPKSEVSLTKRLIEVDGLVAIMNILKTGTMEAKENALSALFRFTDPTNVESQQFVVAHGAYPLLVKLLQDGSVTEKAWAAALIGNLSSSSAKLADATKFGGFWCLRRSHAPLCLAHSGVCTVNTTFCLLKADALPALVRLLEGQVHETAYEAIRALSTLVREDSPNKGAKVLHGADAIKPILEVLTWGTDPLKEEALELLEKVFAPREMVDLYGSKARSFLVGLTGPNYHVENHIGRKAARILSRLERYSRSTG